MTDKSACDRQSQKSQILKIANLKSLLSGSIACQPVLRLSIRKTTAKADPTIALGTKFAALANIPNRSPSRSVPLLGISMLL
jgi:hypothetical protein